jgi:inner membrane protein
MLPDIDGVFGILAGDFGRFHNNGTHSLVLGFAIAFLVAGAIWIKQRSGFISWFTITFLSYGSHVLLDFFTYGGRGVMLLWPFTSQRFESSVKLFYGVRWSEGFLAVEHLVTLTTELLFVLLVITILQITRWNRDRVHAGRVITNSE